MPLDFPASPSLNDTYSFGGKTWIWNGSGWALNTAGAINDIPIGNVTANTGNFTTLEATSFTSTGNVTGANLVTAGDVTTATVTATGNITGGNLVTAGDVTTATVTATGNANVGNLGTAGLIVATGNITGGNLDTAGTVTATGNITGGNLDTAGTVTATGNITGGNVLASGYFFANGAPFTSAPGGSNTEIQFNDAGSFGGTAGFTFNKTTNAVSTTGTLSATGNVTGGNILGNGAGLSGINAFGNIAVAGETTVAAGNTSDTLTFAEGSGISIVTDAANNIITIGSVATDSIFATGGDMGTVEEAVTVSEDLGLITDAATVEYDLGLIVTSGIIQPDSLILPTKTVAQLANLSANPAAQFVYCSDESGGAVPAFSDGTNWRRVTDRAVVT